METTPHPVLRNPGSMPRTRTPHLTQVSLEMMSSEISKFESAQALRLYALQNFAGFGVPRIAAGCGRLILNPDTITITSENPDFGTYRLRNVFHT